MLWSLTFWFLILPLFLMPAIIASTFFTLRPRPIQYDAIFVARMLLIPVGDLQVYVIIMIVIIIHAATSVPLPLVV